MSGENHDLLIKVSKDVEYIKANLEDISKKISVMSDEVDQHDTWITKHKTWHKVRAEQQTAALAEHRWALPLFLSLVIFLTNLFLWGLENFLL